MSSIQIHTFTLEPDWMHLMQQISTLDRFDAFWSGIENKEGQTLKQLKSIATVKSVGASTRIEGSKMSDAEVEALLEHLSTSRLEERDEQEVAGYYETLELITGNYQNIDISESSIQHLHNLLMKYSTKDEWHKGRYKQHSNVVERNEAGEKPIIFKTTDPGIATADAMRQLIEWYHNDNKTTKLIKIALFVYEFLTIHPFQDGNGRLSRLLGTLLLLKNGYVWVQYVSFEHEIEGRKAEYYKVLMECQRQRPGEEVYPWVLFFLDCLGNIQQKLSEKLQVQKKTARMAPREQHIYSFIENHPETKSGEISEKLNIPLPTVKRILNGMINTSIIEKTGVGKGTNYTITGSANIKKDLAIVFTNENRATELILTSQASFIEIKKIVLQPLFNWTHPDEWGEKLTADDLFIKITCLYTGGFAESAPYPVLADIYSFQPVVNFAGTIKIPEHIIKGVAKKHYPLQVRIELMGNKEIHFKVMLVYDEG